MLRKLRDFLCRYFCSHEPNVAHTELPQPIIEASHKMANTAAKLAGSARIIRRETDKILAALHETVKEGGRLQKVDDQHD